jgi:hypothetical protein
LAAWRRAHERARKDSAQGPGRPLSEITDPFELEVHRLINPDQIVDLAVLPPYVPRAHDGQLAGVVRQAIDGESSMAVLVAGSSAGKTRALWEALAPLRDTGRWRLWRPWDPTRREALDRLEQVEPHTVVWLNEMQEYFGGEDSADERVAVALKKLLTDTGRGRYWSWVPCGPFITRR